VTAMFAAAWLRRSRRAPESSVACLERQTPKWLASRLYSHAARPDVSPLGVKLSTPLTTNFRIDARSARGCGSSDVDRKGSAILSAMIIKVHTPRPLTFRRAGAPNGLVSLMATIIVIAALLVMTGYNPVSAADGCEGADCLAVVAVRKGTRCGNSTSFEVDVRNDSKTERLRGYLIFTLPNGKSYYAPTGRLDPGGRGTTMTCESDGTGKFGKVANTGADPNYPRHPE
jgi:hypothetical protein